MYDDPAGSKAGNFVSTNSGPSEHLDVSMSNCDTYGLEKQFAWRISAQCVSQNTRLNCRLNLIARTHLLSSMTLSGKFQRSPSRCRPIYPSASSRELNSPPVQSSLPDPTVAKRNHHSSLYPFPYESTLTYCKHSQMIMRHDIQGLNTSNGIMRHEIAFDQTYLCQVQIFFGGRIIWSKFELM